MISKKLLSLLFIVVMTVSSGCTHLRKPPVHDEILTYPISYDRAYLKVIEAGDAIPGWYLESTNKNDGLVSFREKGAVGKQIIFVIKRIDKGLTSVEVAKNSQQTRGVGELLAELDRVLVTAIKAEAEVTE